MEKLIIGSRGSKLALKYAEIAKKAFLKELDIEIEIKKITTDGDLVLDRRTSEIGGKGEFIKNIEKELISKNIDVAVHSLKDVPSVKTKGLRMECFLKRNDPQEVLINKENLTLDKIKKNSVIGTSSLRREFQLKHLRPDLNFKLIRGNIDTRIDKINEKNLDGIILAAAGVKSLKLDKKISLIFNHEHILPAAGQGIIAVQCRKEDEIKKLIKRINDRETSLCAIAERRMLQTIGGDCNTAIGVLAEIENHNLKLKAQLFSDSGQERFEYELIGREADASFIGKSVGEKLLDLAGEKFKKK